MNTRQAARWFWPALSVVILILLFSDKAATHPQGPTANVKTADGLTVVTFTVNPGKITVNLPDDIRAGDTISGTVIAEPRGSTKEERGADQTELNKFGIRLFNRPEDKPEDVALGDISTIFKYALINNRDSGNVLSVGLQVVNSGRIISQVTIPFLPMTASGAVITPDPKITPTFIIPPLGQTGRPIVITGPFDGNFSNTSLRTTVQDFEKNTENVSGGFGLIAESPRKAVFTAPNNVIGPIELHLTEGKTQTTGNYRNVGVNLTAPKTSLLKGEKTILTVEVNGLQGLTQPVPLTLESRGVITMEGGVYQPLIIQPSQVGADGRYTTTRGITGVQTGGWSATATVVTHRFDACLQDDNNGNSLIFDPKTGDYIFSQPSAAATKPVILPWIAQTRGSPVQTSDLNLGNPDIKITPCVITLDHNVKDRTIHAQIDTCTHAGSATVQTGSPKVKFTITDRNTRDNTCACGPGCK